MTMTLMTISLGSQARLITVNEPTSSTIPATTPSSPRRQEHCPLSLPLIHFGLWFGLSGAARMIYTLSEAPNASARARKLIFFFPFSVDLQKPIILFLGVELGVQKEDTRSRSCDHYFRRYTPGRRTVPEGDLSSTDIRALMVCVTIVSSRMIEAVKTILFFFFFSPHPRLMPGSWWRIFRDPPFFFILRTSEFSFYCGHQTRINVFTWRMRCAAGNF